MGHEHHHHEASDVGRAFAIGVGLNLAFVIVEAIYGFAAHSLSLVADAGHNLSDVLGLALAWAAVMLARRKATARWTYGYRRSSILAALANAILLLVAVGAIAVEAIRRFAHPDVVSGGIVMAVAGFGIAVNVATALLFVSGRKRDVNVEGAFLHMAADAAVSLGVVIAGAIIARTGWLWLDPAVSLIISIVITAGTWSLLRRSISLALDAVPEGIDPGAVEKHLAAMPGVRGVHHLHVWAMSTTETALTVHLVMPDGATDAFLADCAKTLHDGFHIEHATIQVEHGSADANCALHAAAGP